MLTTYIKDLFRRSRISLSLFLLAALLSPITLAAQDLPAALPGARVEVYKVTEQAKMTLQIFEPEGHCSSDKSPCAVFFFGGGWVGGSVSQFAPHCRYLASRGMVAVVADYRVKNKHQTSPFDCVEDGKSAVRWLRQNAKKLGIDPDRIAAGGGSAGGHVAAATGALDGLDNPNEDLQISSKPNALLLFNPVYDNGPESYGYDRVKERYEEISPIHNVRSGIPPSIVFLGTQDSLIPVETGRKFQLLSHQAGVESRLFLYAGQPHGFFNSPEFRKNATPGIYEHTLYEMDRFLVDNGFLTGEPKVSAPEFGFELVENQELKIREGNRTLGAFQIALDTSTPEARHDTYKPFLHVMDPNGMSPITKGPGGQFTHHRGIFLGFNKIGFKGKRYDLWHMKVGVQRHVEFTEQVADPNQAKFTSLISWETNEGEQIIEEKRTMIFHRPPTHAYALVEMRSELFAKNGDLIMNGDPEHAGAQFRPADEITTSETSYFFHEDGIDPKKDLDLPWAGETFTLPSGMYSVVILNHPDNPEGTRFSAYRDYGRFGAFPSFEITEGESRVLRYQWIIQTGLRPSDAEIQQAMQQFVSGSN